MSVPRMQYRPDLQGLRALAVALVLASHFGFSVLEGGFLGVDIFFVLSGYLITGLLVKEWEEFGSLNLSRFYARRIRRLFPAMLVMVVAVFVFAVMFLPVAGLWQGLAAAPYALTWVSNFFFDFRELGYFESLEGGDFFLHTWSLAVEEQFYLIWPLLLLVLLGLCRTQKSPSRFRASAGMAWIAGGGFAFCYAIQYVTIDSAFYQMPARIWEFSVGGWCAFVAGGGGMDRVAETAGRWSLAVKAAPTVGILLILLSVFLVDDRTPHPGLATMLPVLGTAFVILGGSRNPVTRGLSSGSLVWLGDRSYSIYLWHWPIVLVCQFFIVGDTLLVALSALLLTILLSMVTFSFVEYPFWKGRFASAPRAFGLSSSLCAVLPALALTSFVVTALKNPQEPSGNVLSTQIELPRIYSQECDDWYYSSHVVPCRFGAEGSDKHVVYIGDSIGLQWFSAIETTFVDAGWRMTVFTKSGCPIVNRPVYYERLRRVYKICEEWRNGVLEAVSSLSIDLVIVGSAASYEYSEKQWVEGSREIFSKFRNAADRVVALAGTPKLSFDGPLCVHRELAKWGEVPPGNCTSRDGIEQARRVETLLRQAAATFENVSVVGFVDLVCPDGVCRAMGEDEQIVFRDNSHLADSFVRKVSSDVGARLVEQLGLENDTRN